MSDEVRKKLLRKKKVEQGMELAFDDNITGFTKLIEDIRDGIDVPIDPVLNATGARMDSFLGEAACGNAVEVVKYCLQKGADVNWVGQHNRTPLQRALHNSAEDVIPVLLENGADMRLLFPQERDEEGNVVFRAWDPEDLNGVECESHIAEVLRQWDFSKTLKILEQRAGSQAAAAVAKTAENEHVAAEFKSSSETLKQEYENAVAIYKAAIQLREERIKEYDRAKCEGRLQVLDVAEGLIKASEAKVEETKIKVSVLEQKYKASDAKLRQHQVAMQGGIKYDTEITIAQLEDVIFADVGAQITNAKKVVPLVVDPSGNGLTFLTYRNCLLIDIANSHHMHPKQLRLNILGCLRFGKPLLINLRDKPLDVALATLKEKCEGSLTNLYQWLVLDKTIKEPSKYEQLISDEVEAENNELNRRRFTPTFTERFVVALISQQPYPEEKDMGNFYSVFVSA
jgi:hypothetical protein